MRLLIAGLIVFFAVHSIAILADGWRRRMIVKIGEWPWKGLYSVIAAVGLAFIIRGFVLSRETPVVLYIPPQWLHYVVLILMVPVFPLLLSTYLPGRIQAATRHPMLAATKLWAFAHLLVNGTLADVLLFGAFLTWGVIDRISLKHRAEPWVPRLPRSAVNDIIVMVGGLGIYVAFTLWLHTLLIGVSPLD